MGIFEVTEANRNFKTIEIKAYDYMLRFDKKLNLEASSGTPYNFLNVICNTCEVALAHTQAEIDKMTNGKETLGIYSENDIETYRDLLFYVAQVLQDRPEYKVEKVVDGYTGFLFLDKEGMPLVAMHWEHRFNSMVGRYNEIYKVQMPNITPHVCRHTYCSNMEKSGMNPKTLQYLMGHSDIAVTLNVYTHVGLEDAEKELQKMQGLENARKEMGLSDTDDKPLKQNMFKVV